MAYPSFFDPATRRALVDRLATLAPDRPARWGRMTAPMMVLHLIESMRMAAGEIRPRPRLLPLAALLRPLVIHHIPWPKGAPTAPELLAGVPSTFAADVEALRQRILTLAEPGAYDPVPPHPAFGAMRKRDWAVLIYRHIDHHLRQFGC